MRKGRDNYGREFLHPNRTVTFESESSAPRVRNRSHARDVNKNTSENARKSVRQDDVKMVGPAMALAKAGQQPQAQRLTPRNYLVIINVLDSPK
jgi:hypothetical protein